MVPQPEEAGAYPASFAANDQEDASGRQLSIGLRDALFSPCRDRLGLADRLARKSLTCHELAPRSLPIGVGSSITWRALADLGVCPKSNDGS